MGMRISILWRRLDVEGWDACWVDEEAGLLEGTAAFRHPEGAGLLKYAVRFDADWLTVSGSVKGYLGSRRVEHVILRGADGWLLDGKPAGLGHLTDLDFGFTPATNYLQLKRMGLAIGESRPMPVAWMDADSQELSEVAQRYERRGQYSYWYEAPSFGYAELLEVLPSGVVCRYPGLWEAD